MGNFSVMKDGVKQLSQNNIIRLLVSIIIKNIDGVYDYSNTKMYYKDDVVYRYEASTDRHMLYICNKNSTTPGAFNPADWDEYSVSGKGQTVVLESVYKATADGQTNAALNQSLFDFEKDTLEVFHSVRGRLMKDMDWKLAANKTSVDLVGFSLYKNEVLKFVITK